MVIIKFVHLCYFQNKDNWSYGCLVMQFESLIFLTFHKFLTSSDFWWLWDKFFWKGRLKNVILIIFSKKLLGTSSNIDFRKVNELINKLFNHFKVARSVTIIRWPPPFQITSVFAHFLVPVTQIGSKPWNVSVFFFPSLIIPSWSPLYLVRHRFF